MTQGHTLAVSALSLCRLTHLWLGRGSGPKTSTTTEMCLLSFCLPLLSCHCYCLVFTCRLRGSMHQLDNQLLEAFRDPWYCCSYIHWLLDLFSYVNSRFIDSSFQTLPWISETWLTLLRDPNLTMSDNGFLWLMKFFQGQTKLEM